MRNIKREYINVLAGFNNPAAAAPPPPETQELGAWVSKTYDFEVITPMFGGGVTACDNDPSKLIRETEIRGALRFWWRATIGAQFVDYQALYDAEEQIWGSVKTPSRVIVRVKSITLNPQSANPTLCHNFARQGSALGYALFPFYPVNNDPTTEKSGYRSGAIKFQINVSYPANLESDVNAALWAWSNFGGIGARTRRGLGALYCENFAERSINSLQEHFVAFRQNAGDPKEWATLGEIWHQQTNAQGAGGNAVETALVDALGVYRRFRQEVGFARNSSCIHQNNPNLNIGRSRWPEADSIRRIQISKATNIENNPNHNHYYNVDDSNLFPRVDLGAPIIVHFKKYRNAATQDPLETQIYPIRQVNDELIKEDRLASPVIIRPIRFRNQGPRKLFLFLRSSISFNDVSLEWRVPQGNGHVPQARAVSKIPQQVNWHGVGHYNQDHNGTVQPLLVANDYSAVEALKQFLHDHEHFTRLGGQAQQ